MDQRAIDTLDWLDDHAADVAAHPGAAYAETEILRMLVTETGPLGGGVLAEAYLRDIAARGLPPCANRVEARGMAHAFMFASNFGRDSVTPPVGMGIALDALLAEHEDDTDTLGELLITALIVGHQSSAVTAVRAVFDAAWSNVPRTFDNYHVILVGGILYALAG